MAPAGERPARRPLTDADGGLETAEGDPSGVALEQWEPVIAVAAAAARGEADSATLSDLDAFLEHTAENHDWAALARVIRRIVDGERGDQLLAGLDLVDTALTQELLHRIDL